MKDGLHLVPNVSLAIPRKGELVATLPEGVQVVGMVVQNGRLFIALPNGVYEFDGEKFIPFMLADPVDGLIIQA